MTALLRKAALLFLILSSFYSQAQTNRYVNPTGSDASDCANPHTPCATIDYAMTQIVTGDIINLSAGLHASTTLNDGIYLIGEGDISIVQGITVSGDDITIENIKIEGGTTGITANGSNLTIKNVNCSGHSSRGIRVTSSAALTNLTISNCNLNDNNYGLWLDDDTDLDGLSVTNSSMDNGRIGFYSAYAASTNTGDVTNVTFRNCTFNNNTDKGIYVEKLDNALFENISVIGSGVRSDYVWNAGIDINLKWKAYSNITIRNARILDCGAIGSNNIGSSPENRRAAAITIKARTDASSYNSPAASLNNVTLEGVIINGLVNDIRFGEVDKVDNDGIDMSTVSISHCSFGNDDVYSFVNEENNGTLDLQYNYWGGATVSTADFSSANTTQSNDLANEIVDNANNSYATLSAALAGGNPTIRNLPSGTISGTTTISSAVTLISPGAGYLNDESRTTFENLTVNGGDLLMSSDIAISGDLALTNDLDIGNNFNIILDGTTSGSGAITADGTTGLIIEGNGDIASLITSADFERVSIDRPNGTVTLGADLSTEHLLLTNGLFNTSSTHEIIFTGLTALPGNDDSYVQGPMSASVTTTVIGNKVVFPVGKSEYHPIIFEGMDHTGAASLQAEFIEADPSGDGLLIGGGILNALDMVSSQFYWSVDPTLGVIIDLDKVTVGYQEADQISEPDKVRIAQLQNISIVDYWVNIGGSGSSPLSSGNPPPNVINPLPNRFTLASEGTSSNFTSAATVYVDGAGDDTADGLSLVTPKATLSSGYALVSDGGTIHLAAGTYNEAITINKSITITGTSSPVIGEVTINTLPTFTDVTADIVNVNSGVSIGSCITLASTGGTVNVASGTFNELISISKALTLNGANAAVSGNDSRGAETIITKNGLSYNVQIASDNVTIDGFQLGLSDFSDNTETAISSSGYNNFTIQNSVINAHSNGIFIYNVSTGGVDINHNQINMANLIDPFDFYATPSSSIGVLLDDLNGSLADVVSNLVINGASYGIMVHGADNSAGNLSISDIAITDCTKGIEISNVSAFVGDYAPSHVSLSGVAVSDFNGPGAGLAQPDTQAGIYAFVTGNATTADDIQLAMDDIEVSGTGNSQSDYSGIYIADFQSSGPYDGTDEDGISVSATLTNSYIHHNENRGVYVRGRNATLDISQSTIAHNGFDPNGNGYHMYAHAYGTATATNCFFTSPTTSAQLSSQFDGFNILDNNCSLTISASDINQNNNGNIAVGSGIDLSGNYFNSLDESTIAGWVNNQDFTPYLASGTDTDAGTSGFQPDASQYYVTSLGAQTLAVNRNQEGHNTITEGGTIYINDGDYTGDAISLTKDLNAVLTGTPEITDLSISGNKTLNIAGNLLVHGDLSLTNSIINISSGSITLSTSASDIVESSTAYVTGIVTMEPRSPGTGSSALDLLGANFDIGTDVGEVTISRTTGSSAIVNGTPAESIAAVWEISSTIAPSGDTDIDFIWVSPFDNSLTLNPMDVYQNTGSSWTAINDPQDASGRSISIVDLNNFGSFTVSADGSALPVELISISATNQLDYNLLQWETASEINHDYFEIQRSADGNHFAALDRISSQHNSTTINNYEWKDFSPLAGNSYYRLKMVDFDGYTEYSPVASVNLDYESVVLHPNPATEVLNIQSSTPFGKVEVISTSGKRMALNVSHNQIDISSLQPGIYMLKMVSNAEVIQSRFIKE